MRNDVTFEQPVLEIMRRRASWRTYDDRPVEPATWERLTDAVAGIRGGPFGSAVRLGLFEVAGVDSRALRSCGTYGVITGARRFLVGAVARGPFDGAFDRPLGLATAGLWAECLEMVRLGPSASNQQPWRVARDPLEPVLHFYHQRSRTYAVPERLGLMKLDLQRVDLGIAMCHFSLAATALGVEGRFEAWPTPPEVGPLPHRTRYVASFVPPGR